MAKKKKIKPGAPDPFQHLEVNATPATEDEVQDAISSFIRQFVVRNKRERASLFLLSHGKRERGLGEVWRWLDGSKTEELEGSTGFPQHLVTRLGELRGVYVDAEQCVHLTAAEAAVLGHDCAIFISQDRKTALLFDEIGPPTLFTAS